MPATRPKILLVDDVDFILDTERDFLKRTPADILTARAGQEALTLVRRERPQLVYLDTTLPDLDGREVCRLIKADPFLRLIPVVLLFAAASDLPDNPGSVCGCDAALAKPLERIAFLDAGYTFLFHIERREKRVASRIPVHCVIGGETLESVSADVSQHGVYVQYRAPIQTGTAIAVRFTLPVGGAEIEAHGRVAWVNQGFPRTNLAMPQGFGVHFQKIAPGALAQLASFVEQQEELRPEQRIAPASSTAFLGK